MNNNLKETVQRIAREITSKNTRKTTWNGSERRKHKREEIQPRKDATKYTMPQDRRILHSVFARPQKNETELTDKEDENIITVESRIY